MAYDKGAEITRSVLLEAENNLLELQQELRMYKLFLDNEKALSRQNYTFYLATKHSLKILYRVAICQAILIIGLLVAVARLLS